MTPRQTFALLRALRTVIRADSDPARQVLFANLMESRLQVRLAYGLHGLLGDTWARALFMSGYGLASFLTIAPPRHRAARVFAVACHANAIRQVERVASWIGPDECSLVRTGLKALIGPSGLAGLARLLTHGRLRRTLRVIRRIDRRHGFLVSCRAASAMA